MGSQKHKQNQVNFRIFCLFIFKYILQMAISCQKIKFKIENNHCIDKRVRIIHLYNIIFFNINNLQ